MTVGLNLTDRAFALTGGIGTGKSVVAEFFRERGARIIDTDRIAREVVEPGKPALSELTQYFGQEVISPDGTLNREGLRNRIIRDRVLREKLNSIIHPRVKAVMAERISAFSREKDGMPVIVDVPLLYEVGWERLFRDVILAYAPVSIQIRRLMERDKLDRRTAELTIASQMSIDEKRSRAKYIIDNSGTLEHTRVQVERLFDILRKGIIS
ncbi:MAG: dephospho-CoA kinase [Spirochaetes bacterium RBG_16_49_21]|nr:MAG: dephospho-CoA kinase [Spirochaetes bacterium RBG_16_49_21]